MKKTIFLCLFAFYALNIHAQFGFGKKNKDDNSSEGNKLPKGIEIYDTPHSDEQGISGKYYTKYPITLEAKNMMNMPKPFQLSELTIEYRPDEFNAAVYYVKDEPKNQIRSNSDKFVDLEIKGGKLTGKPYIEKYKQYVFKFRNKLTPGSAINTQAFCDPFVFQYSKDPEIFIVADISSDKKDGKDVAKFFPCRTDIKDKYKDVYLGPSINLLCKNKEKLEAWDSAKIASVAFEEFMAFIEKEKNIWADEGNLPPRRVTDAARDKENFNLIKPLAEKDKPKPWGLDYTYIAKDWQVVKKGNVVTHRTSLVVAVSNPMDDGLCKYIYCSINQNWDGTKFGPSFMAGFSGALIPISCSKAAEFKKN